VVASESKAASRVDRLRALGLCCAATSVGSILGAITAMILDSQELLKWCLAAGAISITVPYVAMRWHMATSNSLARVHKQRWRDVAHWGGFGFIAAFFYLIRTDRRLGR
jgi:hypothetical protein